MKGRIAIACGGSGGHIFPALAVAEKLVQQGHEVRLYISAKKVDQDILAAYPQYQVATIPGLGWTGFNLSAIRVFKKLFDAYRVCLKETRTFKPHVVLSMGSFTGAPLLMAAITRHIPVVLHDSNVLPGRTTRWFARFAKKIFVGFKETSRFLPSFVKPILSGTPVRSRIVRKERAGALNKVSLAEDRKTVLIVGGSQGAQGLNQLVIKTLPDIEKYNHQWQFIHLTGPQDVELARANYRRYNFMSSVYPFFENMEDAYSAADLVIARSGASTFNELCYYKLPASFVPLPTSADNHQLINARVFTKLGAGEYIEQGPQAHMELAEKLNLYLNDTSLHSKAVEALKQCEIADAADRIVTELEGMLKS